MSYYITSWHFSFWQNPVVINVVKKFENNKPCLHLVWQPIETLHDIQKFAKSGVPYILILDITGGI